MASRKGIKPVNITLRKLAIEAIHKSLIHKRFGLNVKTIWTIYKRYEKTGDIEPGKKGHRQPNLTESMKNKIYD